MRRGGYKGAARLQRLLRRLPDDMTVEVTKTIAATANAILEEARAEAPKDTGLMASLMSVRLTRGGMRARIGFITARARREAYYARFVEFGTVKKAARPFLIPAYMKRRDQAREDIRSAIAVALDRAAGDKTGGADE